MNLPYEKTRRLNEMLWRRYCDKSRTEEAWSLDRSEWKEYLVGLGCSLGVEGHGYRHMAPPPNKIEGTVVLNDPANWLHGVAVPDEFALKALVLGYFP